MGFPDWQIFGVDMDSRHGGRLYVDQYYEAPSATSELYVNWLQAFVKKNEIDYCLPTSEAELKVLARRGGDEIGGARLLWAGPTAVSVGCDKLRTAEFIESAGVPAPWTLATSAEIMPASLPCLFKLRRSAGSKAVFVCNSIEEVRFFAARYPDSVVQEFLPDSAQEITCAVYRTHAGEVAVLQMLRQLVEGKTNWASVVDYPAITEQCSKIAHAIDLHGSINVQLRMTPNGPRIFEINPRLSSTVLMRHLIGFTDVLWMLDEASGKNVQLIRPKPGMVVVRTQGAKIEDYGIQ